MINYKALPTEQRNPASENLDSFSIAQIIHLMNQENKSLPLAIASQSKNIEKAVELIVKSLKGGGRLFFVGAGTSGRFGVLESAEMPPTFGTHPQLVQAIMAGGKKAVFQSQEGAEDNFAKAKLEINKRVKKGDIVVGVAASGVTPFVRSAIIQAKKIGAETILFTCNAKSPIRQADVVIAPRVGPEIIAGSTRLKAGTVTKMVLNMLTTVSMVQLGKVYKNRMVDLQPKSKKLRERGIALVEELAHLSRTQAIQVLKRSKWHVKTAILMARKVLTYPQAVKILKKHNGFLAESLNVDTQ